MQRLIAVIGPTAVGKTRLGIELAGLLNTEIISGDSMLVYRGLDIGTAKPGLAERNGIVHHLIDILEPEEEFSVTKFISLADRHISQLNAVDKIPILAGGTGLYVKALLEGYQFNITPGDAGYRDKLTQLAQTRGNEYVHQLLLEADPAAAARLHPNDLRRIIRALEVHSLGGENISQRKLAGCHQLVYDAAVIGLTMNRQHLYDRINRRVDNMIAQGLVEEVSSLLAAGLSPACQSMKGIGYKEIIAYLSGEVSLSAAIDAIKQATRHFAKRQLTWYNKMPYIHWVNVDDCEDAKILLPIIYKHIAGKFCLG